MKKNFIRILSLIFISAISTACLENGYDHAVDGAVLNPVTEIFEVRSLYHEREVTLNSSRLNGASATTGVVVSDSGEGNIPADHLIVQSTDEKSNGLAGKRSTALLFILSGEDNSRYHPGDSVVIDLEGTVLKKADGNLQITGITPDRIRVVRSGVAVQPKTVTLTDLYINFEKYEHMLVAVNADIYPLPAMDETLAGEKRLLVSGDSVVFLATENTAAFASLSVKPSAEFTGITYYKDDQKTLRMRVKEDMQNACGPLYVNWPEDFESPSIKELGDQIPKSMTSYNSGDNKGIFKTGDWTLFQSILVDPELAGTLGRDRISGEQGIRMQQQLSVDGHVQMDFDVTKGASKVTFTYGSYYNDASSTFCLEYSQDQGESWTMLDDWISDPDKTMQVATYMMDFRGNIRFRVTKKGLGSTNTGQGIYNGRLSIDNIYIYQNEW